MNDVLLPIFIALISQAALLDERKIKSFMRSASNKVTITGQEEKKRQQHSEWSKFLKNKNHDYKKKNPGRTERINQPLKNNR